MKQKKAYETAIDNRNAETKKAKKVISNAVKTQYEVKDAYPKEWDYTHVNDALSKTSTDAPPMRVITDDDKLQVVYIEYDNTSDEVTLVETTSENASLPSKRTN